MDHQALRRHYASLTDDALREALGAGPDAYRPPAWSALTRLAASRGMRYVGRPDAGAAPGGATTGASSSPRPQAPMRERLLAAGILAVVAPLMLNEWAGWGWFGDADRLVSGAALLAAVVFVLRRAPRWTAVFEEQEAQAREAAREAVRRE